MKSRTAFRVVFVALAIAGSACTEPHAGNGLVIWRVASGMGTDGVPLVPASNGDTSMLYFATADHRIRKIRASDGTLLWDKSTGESQPIIAAMNAVLSGEVVALSRVDIVAFDTTTGAHRWTYVAPGLEETGDGFLAADASTIYAAGFSGTVHAINAADGTARWIEDLSEGGAHVAAFNPVLSGGRVFVCTKSFDAIPDKGKLWALDAATGNVLWSRDITPARPTLGSACYGGAVIWKNFVIQPWQDSRVFAYDQTTGEVQWSTPTITGSNGNDVRRAAISGDVVVVTSVTGGGAVVGYSAATGAELWRQTELGGSLFPPAADATTVFVDHGWYYASYDVATGFRRWSMPLPGGSPQTAFKGTAIVGSDRIYVGGHDGSYAVRR